AGVVRDNGGRALHSHLAAVPRAGRAAVFAPAPPVTTNQGGGWGEDPLAPLLRQAGARGGGLRLPPQGRRRSNPAGFDCWQGMPFVHPPRRGKTAKKRAQEAAETARELDAERRALPRHRASPKLEKAVEFLRQEGAQSLSMAAVRRGKEAGHSKSTLV